jgi:hypothetical protein
MGTSDLTKDLRAPRRGRGARLIENLHVEDPKRVVALADAIEALAQR